MGTSHPQAVNANAVVKANQTRVEEVCAKICDITGSPTALGIIVMVQLLWVAIGQVTHLDPYPFAFMLTVSNVIQLILIFVLAVGQRQSAKAAEIRVESDHASISHLLEHQDRQEEMLTRLLAIHSGVQ